MSLRRGGRFHASLARKVAGLRGALALWSRPPLRSRCCLPADNYLNASCAFWNRTYCHHAVRQPHRAPFGVAGGGPGALGENLVQWPSRLETLGGRDERQLLLRPSSMRTPGGGGGGPTRSPAPRFPYDPLTRANACPNPLFESLIGGVSRSGGLRAAPMVTKRAIAGGLLGVLLFGDARRLVGTGVKVGGAALIGGLAYKAYEDWKSGKTLPATDAGADARWRCPTPTRPSCPPPRPPKMHLGPEPVARHGRRRQGRRSCHAQGSAPHRGPTPVLRPRPKPRP